MAMASRYADNVKRYSNTTEPGPREGSGGKDPDQVSKYTTSEKKGRFQNDKSPSILTTSSVLLSISARWLSERDWPGLNARMGSSCARATFTCFATSLIRTSSSAALRMASKW